jgi:hypothetical protein
MRTILTALALAALCAGCGGHDESGSGHEGHEHAQPAGKPAPAAADALPSGVMLAASPGAARDVADVKKTAKPGEDVIVRGRIGTLSPFVEGRAVVTIVDPAIVPCTEMSMDDACETPWDYCCSPKEEIAAHSATVQVVGADGQPLRHDLRLEGLAPLWYVVVKGKVAAGSSPSNLVVNADGIWVEKKVAAK